jgi:hypothetical protein
MSNKQSEDTKTTSDIGPKHRFVASSDTSGVGGEADMPRRPNRRGRPKCDIAYLRAGFLAITRQRCTIET